MTAESSKGTVARWTVVSYGSVLSCRCRGRRPLSALTLRQACPDNFLMCESQFLDAALTHAGLRFGL